MPTALITHPACRAHNPGAGHPESPQRLEAILRALDTPQFANLLRHEAPRASRESLLSAHSVELVDAILGPLNSRAQKEGLVALDPDTFMSPGSAEAALRAAGAAILAVEEVAARRASNAFCAIRPPGHHAEHARAMGFCLFDNVAIAALHARKLGFQRIAIVDFDVHHGNGTQEIFWNDPDALFISTHQTPLYPGSGGATERGASGNILNLPLPAGANGRDLARAYETRALPALTAFRPDFLFISAGFDAHVDDPLAGLAFTERDFAWATKALCDVARQSCQGRVVSVLEGGYDLAALARSVAAHVGVLMEF